MKFGKIIVIFKFGKFIGIFCFWLHLFADLFFFFLLLHLHIQEYLYILLYIELIAAYLTIAISKS